VHERGVGETRSCGTGAGAAAYAALADRGAETGTVVVDVPGGRLSVRVERANGSDADVFLRGYERVVAVTRSVGTGARAAAYAALVAAGRSTGTVAVDVPGGRLSVGFDGRTTVLSGPAVVVSAGTLTAEWLAG
jgi:diaminopimelate epimerase